MSRSQSLKPLQGAEWEMKHQCLEVKPFVFMLAAENSVGAVRRACPMSVLLKDFWSPDLVVQTGCVCTAQSLLWSLTQNKTRNLCLSCLHTFLTKIHHVCAHLTHGGQVPLEGAMLQRLRQALPSTAVVTCCSPLLCFLLLFVTWPFRVIPGSSVSLLCSLKWDQAKG